MSVSGLWGRLGGVREELRAQLWPLPTVGIIVGVVLGVVMPRLDAHIDPHFSAATASYLFGGGPSAARTFLGAIAGSLITVTSLTFSLTVVTLQLASSQFSPRLLRTFSRDRLVHVTLALFMGTFTYALAVLRTVRDARGSQAVFVPQVSVTLAFVLCLLSVLGLVVFLAHLAQQIRVEPMPRNVHRDASKTVRRLSDAATPMVLPRALGRHPQTPWRCWPALRGSWCRSTRRRSWQRRWTRTQSDVATELGGRVADALTTGFERTPVNDVGYGLRQLTDVASKALSPGINDPTSAVHALGHTSALLCELADYDLGPRILYGADRQLRVILDRPGFGHLLEIAISQPRRYGAADPHVLARLLELLAEVAWRAQDGDHRQAVADQLARLQATVGAQDFDAAERQRLTRLADRVRLAQERRWVPAARG